jgi:homoserine O-succinyltransferase/O-acetyltransferase
VPVIIDGGRVPPRLAEIIASRPAKSADHFGPRAQSVNVALINNMPDAALEDTEQQFFDLLDAAASDVPVNLKLYSLPELPRTERGQQHLDSFYFNYDDLWKSRPDGVIITGTEPRQPDLSAEPYWQTLTDTLDWAADNTVSTVASCLAAHASVLHSDGITRHRMEDKKFGVFEHKKPCEHPLTRHLAESVRIPHSRWNEVREDALTSSGYTVLTKSGEAGVDLFVKTIGKSLFVHFQGHPEYGLRSLLKEYRRDIRRFLRQERDTYPSMPHGYFDADAQKLLADFQRNAMAQPSDEIIESFPETIISDALRNTWQASASRLYKNWLQYVAAGKADAPAFATVVRVESKVPVTRDANARVKR